jgi:hypothetical protein
MSLHKNIRVYFAYSEILGDLEIIEVDKNLSSGIALYGFRPEAEMVVHLLDQPCEEAEDILSNYNELDGIFKETLQIKGEPLTMEEYAILKGIDIDD